MLKYILFTTLLSNLLFSGQMTKETWKRGQTFSHYLDKNKIPTSIIENISAEDRKFLSDIQSDSQYLELVKNKKLIQSLIPINDEMQIHLYLEAKSKKYKFDIIPIKYKENEYFAKVVIKENPYIDTLKTVKNENIAKRVSQSLETNINTRKINKGDTLSFYYKQKTRFGTSFGMPDIKIVKFTSGRKSKFIFVDEDGDGHLEKGSNRGFSKNGDFFRKVAFKDKSKRLGMPLRHVRITSKFTLRRFHPILKRYRPHHGTDFGARKGTPLLSIYSGKVIFAGWMGGYGKVVKIKHPMGFESLYAHQTRIKVKKGQKVTKGQIIGYVGSTGRSTGPHLHFGLKKNKKWVNPMKYLSKKSMDKKKFHTITMKDAKNYKKKLITSLKKNDKPYVWDKKIKEKAFTKTASIIN